MIRHIFAAMAMACFTFLTVNAYAEELNDSTFHLPFSQSRQQTISSVKFDKESIPANINTDIQACQTEWQPCFNSSDCCGYLHCKEHNGVGWVCY